MMTCSCPACVGFLPNGEGAFPIPLRIRMIPNETISFWAWLTARDASGNVEIKMSKGRSEYVTFDSCLECVTYCTSLPQSSQRFTPRQIEALPSHVMAFPGGTPMSLSQMTIVGSISSFPRCDVHDPLCYMNVSAVDEPLAARKRRRTRKSASPPPVPRQEIVPEQESMTVDSSVPGAHSLASIGGDATQVKRIHSIRPRWDSEVVNELIRYGATPRLHEIRRVIQRVHYKDTECVFVEPSGRLVPMVFVPFCAISLLYPDASTPFR